MISESVAIIALAASLLGTLLVSTWRFASLAMKLTTTIERLEDKVSRVEAALEALEHMPELRIKVDQLEAFCARFSSWMPRAQSQLDVHESKILSLRQFRRVTPSQPDLEGDE